MNAVKCGWCSDPAAAAKRLAEEFPADRERTISIADEVCSCTFTFRDHWEMERTHEPVTFREGAIEWEQAPAGDQEWVFALNRHTCLVNLGKAYRFTGDEKYGRQFAFLVSHWLDNVPLTEKSHSGAWRSLETGLRAENWLRAMELFKDSPSLTPELKSRMEESLDLHAQWLCQASTSFQLLSNWGVLQDHGLFLIGIFLDRPEWTRLALSRLYEESRVSVFRDGSQWEQSPMYHCEVLHCLLDTVLIARRAGIMTNEEFTGRVRRMAHALAVWCKPDGRMTCQSDSDDMDARDLLAQAALLFGDSGLKWHAHGKLYAENIWDFGAQELAYYEAFSAVPPREPDAALPDSGNYMMRQDLSRSANWLHFHCGVLGSGHGHADQLHIDLSAHGEDVLIDPGRYTYVDGELRRALKGVASHNTTRVDGVDFSVPQNSWGYGAMAFPIKGEYCFTPQAGLVSGAHLGYMDRGVFVSRRVVYLKPDIWVVFDAFYGRGEHQLEQFFHFGMTGDVRQSADGAFFRGRLSRARVQCLGDGLSLRVDRRPCSREYNRLEECSRLNVSRAARDFGWFVTVLSVSPLSEESCAQAELCPVSLLKAGTLLPESKAQAVRIVWGDRDYTVLACHEEIISDVDLLSAGGRAGYGKVLVFGEGMPEHGLCLAW